METTQLIVLCLCIISHVMVHAEEDGQEVGGIVGGQVTLTCDLPTSDPPQIAWMDNIWNMGRGKEPIFNSSISPDIAATHKNKDNMEIQNDYSLIIKNLLSGMEEDNKLEVSSSGDYYCYSLHEGQWLEKKFFIILSETPTCSGSADLIEGESTKLTCSAMFSGKMPELQWFRNGQKVDSKPFPAIGMAQSSLEIEGATYMDDEAIYTCRMTIGQKNEECQQLLSVKYMVRDMKLSPMDDVLTEGQEIRCSARGNPPPKITLDPQSSSAYSGKGFRAMEVPKDWLNQMTTVVCSAQNTFDGKVEIIEKSITFNVTVPRPGAVEGDASKSSDSSSSSSSSSSPGGNVGGMIAGIIIGALVFVVIIVAIVCLKRKDSQDRSNKDKPPTNGKEDQLLTEDENHTENKVV